MFHISYPNHTMIYITIACHANVRGKHEMTVTFEMFVDRLMLNLSKAMFMNS